MRNRNTTASPRLSYVVSHETWYATMLGGAARPGLRIRGAAWEFGVEEYGQDGHRPIMASVPSEAFAAFAEIPEFFAALPGATTLDEVRGILDRLGAADVTDRAPRA